jgi:hypothetical protein
MYTYLLLNSICDMLISIIQMISFFLKECKDCAGVLSYIYAFWHLYIDSYLQLSLLSMSGIFEIASSFECAILVNRKLSNCRGKIPIFCGIFCSLSFIISSNIFFFNEISAIKKCYNINAKEHTLAEHSIFVNSLNIIFRDFLSLVIILCINIYVLIRMRFFRFRNSNLHAITYNSNIEETNKTNDDSKKRLNKKSSSVQILVLKRQKKKIKSENRKIKMIIVFCLLNIFGHFPMLFNLITHNVTSSKWHWPEPKISMYALKISYTLPLFVYFIFNNKFRKVIIFFFVDVYIRGRRIFVTN